MGLFGKSLSEIFMDAITDSDSSKTDWFNPIISEPSRSSLGMEDSRKIFDKLETVFMDDVETEGQKRGYERAAAEYDAAFERIENDYCEAKRILDQQADDKKAEAARLISKLQELQQRKSRLEQEIEEKTEKVADKYDLPISTVSYSVGSVISDSHVGVLDLIYHYKNKKLQEAEAKGYEAARKIYKAKIRELKDNLERLKSTGDKEIQEMCALIRDVLKEISNAETKIAELEIALHQ